MKLYGCVEYIPNKKVLASSSSLSSPLQIILIFNRNSIHFSRDKTWKNDHRLKIKREIFFHSGILHDDRNILHFFFQFLHRVDSYRNLPVTDRKDDIIKISIFIFASPRFASHRKRASNHCDSPFFLSYSVHKTAARRNRQMRTTKNVIYKRIYTYKRHCRKKQANFISVLQLQQIYNTYGVHI